MKQGMDISTEIRSVRRVVYEKLREAIIAGFYQPGERLNERKLAVQFKISTTPLKEALRLLEQEGLIVSKPRIGSFVSSNLANFIEEIILIRSALEGVAARLAAMKINDNEIKDLDQAIKRMEQYTKDKNSKLLFKENDRFHELISIIAKNNYISKQIDSIRSIDRRFRKKALSLQEEAERSYNDHFQIYSMIIARNPEKAEAKMRFHIDRTSKFYTTEILKQDPTFRHSDTNDNLSEK